ncbi:methyl-accepting chemotaxis protein [Methanomethylovorans sp.]|uniref:HAMP domain-containing methyl-accepting chemotaxis protein n=1 Tax=Methanomethylovorans sp. TaxID=2758717 RepID=UPI00351BF097
MFENVKIKKLLIASFAVILLLTTIVAYTGYSGMSDIKTSAEITEDMNNLVKYSEDARITEKNYQLRRDTTYVIQMNELFDSMTAQISESRQDFTDSADKQKMDDAQKAVDSYDQAFTTYVQLENEQKTIDNTLIEKENTLNEVTIKMYEDQMQQYSEMIEQNADAAALQDRVLKAEDSSTISKWNLEARNDRLGFMMNEEQQYVDNVNQKMDAIITLASDLKSRYKQQKNKDDADAVIIAATAYKTEFSGYVANEKKKDDAEIQMVDAARTVKSISEAALTDQNEKMQKEMSTALMVLSLISLIAIILGISVALLISRMISKPVDEMLEAANKIAEGNLLVQINNTSENELGQLSTALGTMATNLRKIVTEVKDGSSKVASTSQELSAASEEMTSGAGQISDVVADIAKGSQSQSIRAEEVSRAMKDMTANVQDVASNAQKVASAAQGSSQLLEGISKQSEQLLSHMTEIQTAVSDSAEVIRELDGKSRQIGEIVELITSIADQTNLLALNAAIEAARAGDYGKGFAVVADEVRKLAEDSNNAAKQIAVLVHQIQNETNNAVTTMEKGTQKVAQGAQMFSRTHIDMKTAADRSTEVTRMAQDIAAAAEEQSSSIEQINSSVEEVTAITEQSAAGTQEAASSVEQQKASMEEISTSAQELANLASNLMQLASKFKIEE